MDRPEAKIAGPFTPEEAAQLAEIQQKIYFYGWCIDHRKFDALDDLFTPETIIHYDVPGGTRKPWPEMKRWLPSALRSFRVTQHNMSNPLVELEAERARSRTYGHLIHCQELLDGSISVMRHHTIYRDEWAQRESGWRILERTLSNLHVDGPIFGPDEVRLYDEPKPL